MLRSGDLLVSLGDSHFPAAEDSGLADDDVGLRGLGFNQPVQGGKKGTFFASCGFKLLRLFFYSLFDDPAHDVGATAGENN